MKVLFIVIIAILVAIVAVQNASVVTIAFFNYKFESSLVVVILISFALGLACGIIYMLPSLLKKQMQMSGLKKELTKKEQQSSEVAKQNKDGRGEPQPPL